MTREEKAITQLQRWKAYMDSLDADEDERLTMESLDAAIEALQERKTSGWTVITKSPMDADDIAYWSERLGYEIPDDEAYMYGNLPAEGEEVLVCTQFGRVFIDTMCKDEGCYFEEYGEMDGIVAWMPLPEPYREVDE